VSFSANGTLLCTVDLTAGFEEATACAPSIQAGTNYVITATFTDTNGVRLIKLREPQRLSGRWRTAIDELHDYRQQLLIGNDRGRE
jgi:hypothetical protein